MRRAFFLVVPALLLSAVSVRSEVAIDNVYDFLSAQAAVYKEGSSASVERFVAFLAEDVKDFHVAYGREFSGKEHFRENMPRKAQALIEYERKISQVNVGTNVAIAIFHERSKERKQDGVVKDYDGRTIVVLDFNDEGLITQIRRYQD